MKRTISEQKVLHKLGIPDFRHMTKEKVVEFATILPKMDPEVAKAAIAQFPNFKDLSLALVDQYKEVIDAVLHENRAGQEAFYDFEHRRAGFNIDFISTSLNLSCSNRIRSLGKKGLLPRTGTG